MHYCEYGDPFEAHEADHYASTVNARTGAHEEHYICDRHFHEIDKVLRRKGAFLRCVEPPASVTP